MGCLQSRFDGRLWFLTFRHSGKLQQITDDSQVLVSYARPRAAHYVAISGRGRLIENPGKVTEL
jgi:general stress protein 26